MNQSHDASDSRAPRQTSLLKSSAIMASGTLVSRILGFVRTALLIIAIGEGAGSVSATFQVANTLPNTVYNILAAGVIDAVLVPQIVRALKSRSGDRYVSRLLTLAGLILFGVTIVMMVGSPLLVTLFASSYEGPARALTITFTLLCLPQIFFYGVYNLLGELLNARGMFGPYMWAPVLNNVIAILGLSIFLILWGPHHGVFPIEEFTSSQFWVLAGSATLGVILQALILLIPLRHADVKLRIDWHFKGTSFKSASRVAGWTFATLGVSQIGIISTTNLATQADHWATLHDASIAGYVAYTAAFMVYMVPQSLISVSLATAIFTRMANAVTENDHREVARNFHTGVNVITLLTLLAAAILIAAAVPVMQLVLPMASPENVRAYAAVLIALMPGVASTGMVLMSQRVFFAYEDAKPVFLMGIVPTIIQIIVGWSVFFLAGPGWWTIGASAAETVCRLLQGFIAVFWVARKIRYVNPGLIVASYIKYFTAAGVGGLAGGVAIWLMGASTPIDQWVARWLVAAVKAVVVALVVTIVFALMMRLLDPASTSDAVRKVNRRLPVPALIRKVFVVEGAGASTASFASHARTTVPQAPDAERDESDSAAADRAQPTADSGEQQSTQADAVVDGSSHDTDSQRTQIHFFDWSKFLGREQAEVGQELTDAQYDTTLHADPFPADAHHSDDPAQVEEDAQILSSILQRGFSPSDPTNTGEMPVVSRWGAAAPEPDAQDGLASAVTPDEETPHLVQSQANDLRASEPTPAHTPKEHPVPYPPEPDENDELDQFGSHEHGAHQPARPSFDEIAFGRLTDHASSGHESSDHSVPPAAAASGGIGAAGALGTAGTASTTGTTEAAGAASETGQSAATEQPTATEQPEPASNASSTTSRALTTRINPTIPTVIFAAILVIGGGLWGVKTMLAPVSGEGFSFSPTHNEQESGQSAEQSGSGQSGSDQPVEPEIIRPQVTSVDALSWRNDNGDNPDQAIYAIDGKLDTAWRSRSFDYNQFPPDEIVSLKLNLQEKATVSKVTVHMAPGTTGGELALTSVDPSVDVTAARHGTELATTAMSPTTDITLPEPVETQGLVLMFRYMPSSDEGSNQAWVYEVTVE